MHRINENAWLFSRIALSRSSYTPLLCSFNDLRMKMMYSWEFMFIIKINGRIIHLLCQSQLLPLLFLMPLKTVPYVITIICNKNKTKEFENFITRFYEVKVPAFLLQALTLGRYLA